jgi:hypothetical protein
MKILEKPHSDARKGSHGGPSEAHVEERFTPPHITSYYHLLPGMVFVGYLWSIWGVSREYLGSYSVDITWIVGYIWWVLTLYVGGCLSMYRWMSLVSIIVGSYYEGFV